MSNFLQWLPLALILFVFIGAYKADKVGKQSGKQIAKIWKHQKSLGFRAH